MSDPNSPKGAPNSPPSGRPSEVSAANEASVYPRLIDVMAMPADDKPGHVAMYPRGEVEGDRAVISAAAFLVARQFDGRRSAEDIADFLVSRGVRVPGAAFVVGLARSLEEVGLVVMAESPVEGQRPMVGAGPLRQRCLGCGRSCEGHLIGPLDESFMGRVEDLHASLSETYEDLAALETVTQAVVDDGIGRYFMAQKAGEACVFLGEDRRCRIHLHMGAEAKPMACRYFPLQVVEVEEGLRVGTVECFEAHKTFQEPVSSSPETITGVSRAEMVFSDRRGLHHDSPWRMLPPMPGSSGWRNWGAEHRLLALLDEPDFGVLSLLSFVRGEPLSKTLLEEGSPLIEGLGQRLRRCGVAALENLDEEGGVPGSWFEARLVLLEAMAGFETRSFGGLSDLQRAYVSQVLRDWFYLRNWHRHPSFDVSVACMALGVMFAGWCSQAAGEPGEMVGDVFGHRLVAWSRHFHSTRDLRQLFVDPEDFGAFVQSLEPA